jgi:hypothetical protein
MSMLASEQFRLTVQVATVVVPVAIYFLLLGLLNSQRHPQLIAGRTDFILLIAAFAPTFLVPALSLLGASAWVIVALAAVLAVTALLAPPRKGNWVVYNITSAEVLRAAERALQAMGESFTRNGRRIVLGNRDVMLRFSAMPLLRNVSVAAAGDDARTFQQDFESRLAGQLSDIPSPRSPMAVTFLLIATAMLVAPLGLMADRMPEMVRIITDLIP